ncbi:General transcription factor IIH subunit 1 [Myotis brandtii]|uniref:General transcription factor IIH subunit 1 n=1 Tax=Myotis brandtii TaxID=109478 RepID=S7Q191_MYOBR|nr:General transcription factor IIH subunit 1 [Myotis brandtii]
MEAYTPKLNQVLSSSAATSTITALSPGGALMQEGTQQAINQMVPNDIQSELKHLYVAVGELLRHFWSCFPVNTPFLEEKVVKMKSNLERFQVTKLCPFQEKLRRQYLSTNLVSHIEEMLQTAYNKLHTWQSRRLLKKTGTPLWGFFPEGGFPSLKEQEKDKPTGLPSPSLAQTPGHGMERRDFDQ